MIDSIVQTFEDQGWAYHKIEGANVIETGFEAHHTKVQIHIQAFPEINAVSVVSQSPIVSTSADRRLRVMELIMRVNEVLNIGNFELRWDHGEVVFRATNLFSKRRFDGAVLIALVEATIVEMDRITPCLNIIQKASPAELMNLDIQELMQRDDLVPDVGNSDYLG